MDPTVLISLKTIVFFLITDTLIFGNVNIRYLEVSRPITDTDIRLVIISIIYACNIHCVPKK